jgi:hypothetical protein
MKGTRFMPANHRFLPGIGLEPATPPAMTRSREVRISVAGCRAARFRFRLAGTASAAHLLPPLSQQR